MHEEKIDPATLQAWHKRINALERVYGETMVWQLVQVIKACASHLPLLQIVGLMEQLLPLAQRWGWELLESVVHAYSPSSLSAWPNKLARCVEDLKLSVRTENELRNAGIRHVGELVVKTESELLKLNNFGRRSLKEIKEVLAPMGLTFGMMIEPATIEAVRVEIARREAAG